MQAKSHLRFIYFSIGHYGSFSDGGIYRDSQLRQYMATSRELPESVSLDTTHSVMPHLVGDDAFPLSGRLMTPYPGRSLTRRQQLFNYRLSRARRCIESAFGVMASRFRLLHTRLLMDPDPAAALITSAIILHNISLSPYNDNRECYLPPLYADSDDRLGDWRLMNQALPSINSTRQGRPTRRANEMRDYLTDYFSGSGAVPWQDAAIGARQIVDDQRLQCGLPLCTIKPIN